MMQRMKGTLRPGRKAGVLALAVLLLTCVLMAGAVSAEEKVTVHTYGELVDNLTKDGVGTIILGSDFTASAEISVNRTVTIDGNGHTISAEPGWSQDTGEKNLLVIETGMSDAPFVTLENISFEGCGNATADTLWYADPSKRDDLKQYMGAHGIQVYDTGATQMQLKNIKINGSQGSGIHVNGANVSLVNVTVTNSVWQSVDVGKGVDVTNAATLTIDGDTELLDVVKINVDNPTTAEANVKFLDDTSYKSYSFYYYNDKDYNEMKRVWSTDVDAAAEKIAESKKVTFNATVQNTGDDPLAYHADLSQAMDAAENGATVTQLEALILTEPITIDKAITFDGKNKEIIGSSKTGYFLMVAVPLEGNETESVTLQNLNLSIDSIGSSANLGGITVRANEDKNESVPVILKNSIVDMGDVDMTSTTSMNPAVYFVNAPNSQIINNNKITAGAASSSSTRCVVVDGGYDVRVSGNTLNLGSGTAVAVGVEIKGNDVDKVTVSGNTLYPGTSSGDAPRAVKITAKDKGTDSQKTFTVSKNDIQFGGIGTTVEVLLSTYMITDPANAQVKLNVEENTGSTASVVMLNKEATNDETLLDSTITLTGNIYNPGLTSSEEVAVVGGFAYDGSEKPNTAGVTHVNPAPQHSSGGNMNNAYRVLFNDGSTTIAVETDLSSGDKLTKPETPVKDGYTFAGWYKDSACTQGWDFETGISGDMTLYAKWTAAGSSGETEATTAPTKTQTAVTTPQPTKTQTAAATTSAPEATTAAGVSPTLTQAPAPVAGALFGLLAAGVLLRRRFQ